MIYTRETVTDTYAAPVVVFRVAVPGEGGTRHARTLLAEWYAGRTDARLHALRRVMSAAGRTDGAVVTDDVLARWWGEATP